MDFNMNFACKRVSLIILSLAASSMTLAAQPGFYADLGLGLNFGPSSTIIKSSYFTNSGGTLSSNPSDGYSLETRGVAATYVDAGYTFTPNFGAEVNFTYWGQQNLTNFAFDVTTQTGQWKGNLQSYSYGLSAVGYVPLTESKINLFAKLGIAVINSQLSINDPNGSIFFNPGSYSTTTNDPALTYGVGAEYLFTKNIAGMLEWKGLNRFNDNQISNINFNLIAIGVRYSLC
jgi:opacity protein-like surface antigen